jgi:hypothetical protein
MTGAKQSRAKQSEGWIQETTQGKGGVGAPQRNRSMSAAPDASPLGQAALLIILGGCESWSAMEQWKKGEEEDTGKSAVLRLIE